MVTKEQVVKAIEYYTKNVNFCTIKINDLTIVGVELSFYYEPIRLLIKGEYILFHIDYADITELIGYNLATGTEHKF